MFATVEINRGGVILYDETLLDHPRPELFSAAYWRMQGQVRQAAGGRGTTWIIVRDDADWVLRHYRRGGRMQFLGDRYGWPGSARRTRPAREYRYLAEMAARGLSVPRPVAARVARAGLIYRGDLITGRIAEAIPLSQWLSKNAPAGSPWAAVGCTLARFHALGAAHPDLNAHNILVGPGEAVHLIDFDGGGWRRPGGAWMQRNLARLRRSLLKLAGAADAGRIETRVWPALLAGYHGASENFTHPAHRPGRNEDSD